MSIDTVGNICIICNEILGHPGIQLRICCHCLCEKCFFNTSMSQKIIEIQNQPDGFVSCEMIFLNFDASTGQNRMEIRCPLDDISSSQVTLFALHSDQSTVIDIDKYLTEMSQKPESPLMDLIKEYWKTFLFEHEKELKCSSSGSDASTHLNKMERYHPFNNDELRNMKDCLMKNQLCLTKKLIRKRIHTINPVMKLFLSNWSLIDSFCTKNMRVFTGFEMKFENFKSREQLKQEISLLTVATVISHLANNEDLYKILNDVKDGDIDKCLVCFKTIDTVNYSQFTDCSHKICKECVNRFMIVKGSCPYDGDTVATLRQIHPDRKEEDECSQTAKNDSFINICEGHLKQVLKDFTSTLCKIENIMPLFLQFLEDLLHCCEEQFMPSSEENERFQKKIVEFLNGDEFDLVLYEFDIQCMKYEHFTLSRNVFLKEYDSSLGDMKRLIADWNIMENNIQIICTQFQTWRMTLIGIYSELPSFTRERFEDFVIESINKITNLLKLISKMPDFSDGTFCLDATSSANAAKHSIGKQIENWMENLSTFHPKFTKIFYNEVINPEYY